MFQGLGRDLPLFFAKMRFENTRENYEENRALFEREIKEPMYRLTEALAETVLAIDPQLDTRPARCVSRIRRDTRFTHDKSPYRDHMWLDFHHTGEDRSEGSCFYFDISETAMHWGCGIYHMNPVVMQSLRRLMEEKPGDALAVFTDPVLLEQFEIKGETFKRWRKTPEGMPEALQAIYQHKELYAEHTEKDFDLAFSPELADRVAEGFKRMTPLYELLRKCQIRC